MTHPGARRHVTSKTCLQLTPLSFSLEKLNKRGTAVDCYSVDLISDVRLLWRGSTTGAWFVEGHNWRDSQRARLHYMTHEKGGEREVLWSNPEGLIQLKNVSVAKLNEFYMVGHRLCSST